MFNFLSRQVVTLSTSAENGNFLKFQNVAYTTFKPLFLAMLFAVSGTKFLLLICEIKVSAICLFHTL